MSKNLKTLCGEAEGVLEIRKETDLIAALPKLFALRTAVATMKSLFNQAKAIDENLSKMCTKYALRYPGCFNDGLNEKESGIFVGDITIDKVTYHFSHGYKGFKRSDGGNLSKEFMDGIDEKFKRVKYELNVSAIGKLPAEEIADMGLKREENDVWKLTDDK